MKSSSANVLLVVGECLVIAPLAFVYMTYRLVARELSEAMAHGIEPNVKYRSLLPEYYVPICLALGALCILGGAFLSWRERKSIFAEEHTPPEMS